MALLFFTVIQPIGLPTGALGFVLLIYLLVTAITWRRSKYPSPLTSLEFFAHLQVDILFFTLLLYYSGGASNPFISYYLIPISIAAITLPRRYTLVITLTSLFAYSLLLEYYVVILALSPGHSSGHAGYHQNNNLHILGMWVNFAVSAGVITYFISRMATTLREQQHEIALQREEQLRNEQLLAVGTLAAGTAHELGTPLNSMKIVVDEMVDQGCAEKDDLAILQQQINQCKQTLKQLVETAQQSDTQNIQPQLLQDYFNTIMERWQLMRPELHARITFQKKLPEIRAAFHPTIAQSLLNLLNNATDASPHAVEVKISWENQQALVEIRDHGSGLNPESLESLGNPFVTDKANGLGLGLFLSQATLTRYGGNVSLQNANDGGTLTIITLPLEH